MGMCNSVATLVASCFSWLHICLYTVRGKYFWHALTHSFFCRLRILLQSKGNPKNSCARNKMWKIRVWGTGPGKSHLALSCVNSLQNRVGTSCPLTPVCKLFDFCQGIKKQEGLYQVGFPRLALEPSNPNPNPKNP